MLCNRFTYIRFSGTPQNPPYFCYMYTPSSSTPQDINNYFLPVVSSSRPRSLPISFPYLLPWPMTPIKGSIPQLHQGPRCWIASSMQLDMYSSIRPHLAPPCHLQIISRSWCWIRVLLRGPRVSDVRSSVPELRVVSCDSDDIFRCAIHEFHV